MPRRIRILSDQVANQIAAGEVVERPASVVKELMENALDAGATRVTVAVRNGGRTEIRVADDGHGMGREDALLSLDRHATSKIGSASDLANVRTLGFRGEALPSIASVSRMTIETAERNGEGTRILVKAGQITGVEGCSRRVGTTITVQGLFFNTPARAKFLRSTAAETRAVSEVVTVLALAHSDVGFSLESNGRLLLDLAPAPGLLTRVGDIWGGDESADLIPVLTENERGAVSGLVERPHAATTGGRRAHLFVNGRPFSDRFIVRAVDRGYHTTVAPGVRPSFFLFLDLPDGDVDVNVHPSKAEVRFRYHQGVEQAVENAVRSALRPLESVPSLGARPSVGMDEPGWSATAAPRSELPPRIGLRGQIPPTDPAREQMSLFLSSLAPEAGVAPGADDPGNSSPLAPTGMWQVHNTYIFAETREGLIIVDQHAAHERVLYEELTREGAASGDRVGQRLLFPLTIRLAPAELDLVEQIGPLFSGLGFELEPFGGRSIIVHAVPNPHPYFDAERCLREMIRELTEGSDLVNAARNQHQRIALSFACKAAVKAGQPLSNREIAELFDRLFATELPFHDVHGRPTVVQLSMHELHNRFRRTG